jgi:dihydroorotate dehydrogenase
MKLRNIDFGNILGASGVQGFFGEGYQIHRLWGSLGPNFEGMTFVSKTTTYHQRDGNAELREDFTLRRTFPDCIKARPFRGSLFNSVGLSGPGFVPLFNQHKWQGIQKPFMISIMSVAPTKEERLAEIQTMLEFLSDYKSEFSAPFGVQINLSCPNTDEDPKELIGESMDILDLDCDPEIPRMYKYSIASAPIRAILELGQHPNCDSLCVSNTIPAGWKGLNWNKAWGKKPPVFKKYKGGGLSGKALRPLVCDWIKNLRDAGFTRPINGGGGIFHPKDVEHYRNAGANSAFIGTVASLRPWRVRAIIEKANQLNWDQP